MGHMRDICCVVHYELGVKLMHNLFVAGVITRDQGEITLSENDRACISPATIRVAKGDSAGRLRG